MSSPPLRGYSVAMKIPSMFKRRPAAKPVGNPAYPSLAEREKIVAKNRKKTEHVKKLPADELRAHPQD